MIPQAGVTFVRYERGLAESGAESGVRLKDVEVTQNDILDGDIVGVKGQSKDSAVVCGRGSGRNEGLRAWHLQSSVKSL